MKFATIELLRGSIISSQQEDKSDRVINIGDYAQLFAIEYLYKEMGIPEEEIVSIEYYDLLDYDGDYVVLPMNFIYFNPFYGERKLILSPKIIPVFLGIHCISDDFSAEEIEYLKAFSPVGCRDEHTLNIMRRLRIPSYLQGCLTITFPKRQSKPEDEKVFFVDIPDSIIPFIPEDLRLKAEFISQQYYGDIYDNIEGEKISDFARKQFHKYRDCASLIVTSRLHCASPCVGMGIPTILAMENFGPTFSWIERILNVYTRDRFDKIDWNPKEIELENEKEKIKQLAKDRIFQAYNKFEPMFNVSEFYEKRNKTDVKADYLTNIKRHAEKYWNKTDDIKYAFWGVTQITDAVQRYIEQNFPAAKLVAIFDDYRQINYKGLHSVKTEKLDETFDDCCIIATGNSSSIAAKEVFVKKGRAVKNYCLCFQSKYDKL